jgi:hypothetical protein
MYPMPGEVLNGERPGIMGMSMYQVFAGMVGFFIGSNFDASPPVLGVFAVVCVILARKSRGLYLIENLYHPARWYILRMTGQDPLQDVLNPDELYVSKVERRQAKTTYIIQKADGRRLTVQG